MRRVTCVLNAQGALAATANFGQAITLTVKSSSEGTVTSDIGGLNCGKTCAATLTSGTTVTLTATPQAGSQFTGWSGACSGIAPTCKVTVTADTQVQPNFKWELHYGDKMTNNFIGKHSSAAWILLTVLSTFVMPAYADKGGGSGKGGGENEGAGTSCGAFSVVTANGIAAGDQNSTLPAGSLGTTFTVQTVHSVLHTGSHYSPRKSRKGQFALFGWPRQSASGDKDRSNWRVIHLARVHRWSHGRCFRRGCG